MLRLLLALASADALRIGVPLARPPASLSADFRSAASGTGAVTALVGTPLAAHADDLWVELNKPPINLSPFEINPVGWLFFGLYGSYLAWSILRPPTEAEKAVAERREKEAAEAASLAGDFLQEAASADGARVLPSGLVYCETVPGSGDFPTPASKVIVHYEGKLADGTVFDSSLARNQPAEFKVGQVIKGWQEGLQLMKPGGKATLTIPANLAYGAMSVGSIPGNSALQFEVELLEIQESGGLFGFGN